MTGPAALLTLARRRRRAAEGRFANFRPRSLTGQQRPSTDVADSGRPIALSTEADGYGASDRSSRRNEAALHILGTGRLPAVPYPLGELRLHCNHLAIVLYAQVPPRPPVKADADRRPCAPSTLSPLMPDRRIRARPSLPVALKHHVSLSANGCSDSNQAP